MHLLLARFGISRNQRSSVAISGHQSQPAVISRNQRSSVATSGHQSQSVVISRNQRSSVAISGHQSQSAVISRNHLLHPIERRPKVPARLGIVRPRRRALKRELRLDQCEPHGGMRVTWPLTKHEGPSIEGGREAVATGRRSRRDRERRREQTCGAAGGRRGEHLAGSPAGAPSRADLLVASRAGTAPRGPPRTCGKMGAVVSTCMPR